MKKIALIIVLTVAFFLPVRDVTAQSMPLSERMTATVLDIWADSLWTGRPFKWTYDQGVVLEGVSAVWQRTGDKKYFEYIKKSMDHFVGEDGSIRTYDKSSHNIDNIKNGRSLLLLYQVTGQQKYLKAAQVLRHQLDEHPRTKEGGFWHKRIYPYQMWLDGLYMGQPFYAEYSAIMNDAKAFEDIANQFIFMENNTRDPKTGLLYHGWDESKEQRWANKATGRSPHVWGRAMGWYGMGLVDALEYFPASHPGRKKLIDILNRFAEAVSKVQQPSGLWYDIIDVPEGKGNYLESSAASMFVYAIAKGVRQGYLPESYFSVAKKGFEGMKREFVEEVNAEKINFKGTVSVSGLGGKPYRDGSFEYYMSEKVITNDPKGVGSFISAANEMELAALPKPGLGKTVTLDYYFNNERKKGPFGQEIRYHYTWEDQANSGFWFWKNLFNYAGAKTTSLEEAPSASNLKNSSVYIIVDPDTEKEATKPNFVSQKDIAEISAWVKSGGVLVLMSNDAGNCEFKNFNRLAQAFGITFNEDQRNTVEGKQFEMAAVNVPSGNRIFKTAKKLYIKELSTLKLTGAAESVITENGDVIIATSKVGKGTVFAVGDPWLYNEYVDGRKLPGSFDNYAAANDLAQWLLQQTAKK